MLFAANAPNGTAIVKEKCFIYGSVGIVLLKRVAYFPPTIQMWTGITTRKT